MPNEQLAIPVGVAPELLQADADENGIITLDELLLLLQMLENAGGNPGAPPNAPNTQLGPPLFGQGGGMGTGLAGFGSRTPGTFGDPGNTGTPGNMNFPVSQGGQMFPPAPGFNQLSLAGQRQSGALDPQVIAGKLFAAFGPSPPSFPPPLSKSKVTKSASKRLPGAL